MSDGDAVVVELFKPRRRGGGGGSGGGGDAGGGRRGTAGQGRAALSRAAFVEALAALDVELRFNRFADCAECRHASGDWQTLDDTGLRRLWADSEAALGYLPPRAIFSDLVLDEAARRGFDPLVDYLDGLAWDGEARLSSWLIDYLGAADTPLHQAFGRATLIGAVRRARRPGAKHDSLLVLEGAQGAFKSRAVAALAPRADWFSDCLDLAADPREVIEATRGRWIVEIAELGGLRRADVDRLKALLSRQRDRARPAYGRLPVEVPRQWIAIGTINPGAGGYLLDKTGNRRFWPVPVGKIDPDALAADRAQLWAEAAVAEAAGEPNFLPPDLEVEAAAAVLDRAEENPLLGPLRDALAGLAEVSTDDALARLSIPVERRSRAVQMEAAAALRELGFERQKKRPGERRMWTRTQ